MGYYSVQHSIFLLSWQRSSSVVHRCVTHLYGIPLGNFNYDIDKVYTFIKRCKLYTLSMAGYQRCDILVTNLGI